MNKHTERRRGGKKTEEKRVVMLLHCLPHNRGHWHGDVVVYVWVKNRTDGWKDAEEDNVRER